MPERLREWALVAATVDPRNHARKLDDGISAEAVIDALARFAADPPMAIRTDGLYVALYADPGYLLDAIRQGKGRWTAAREEPHGQGDSEDGGRLITLRRSFEHPTAVVPTPGSTSTPYLEPPITSFAREVEEDPAESTSENGSKSREEGLAIEEGLPSLDSLKRSYATLALMFDEAVPANVVTDAAHTLKTLTGANNGLRLTTAQLETVDKRLRDKLTERAEFPNAQADRFALVRSAIKKLVTDDDLRETLKRLRPAGENGLDDFFAGVGD